MLEEKIVQGVADASPVFTKYYVQINADNVVIGYSSTQTPEATNEIEVEADKLTEQFMNMPFFYRYDETVNDFIFDDSLRSAEAERRHNRLTKEQQLGQHISDLEIQLMMVQMMMQKQPQAPATV